MKYEDTEKYYMNMALELAVKGEGFVSPNPLVGAVIVKDGKVVGKGFHKFFGGPHAEVYALKEAGDDARGGELYVTLEPCSHYGKNPPCAKAVIEAGIKKVVVAVKDPNPLVSGKGIKMLENAGVKVHTGIMEREAFKINEIFMKYITRKIPFVTIKSAVTIDGKIALSNGESKWITGEKSREKVHEMRNKYTAVMAGIGTIIKDDPLLTTRLGGRGRSPRAILIDSKLRIPISSKILGTLDDRDIVIACTENFDKSKFRKLENMGVKIIVCPEKDDKVDLKYLVKKLGKEGIDSILVEGGGRLNFSVLESGIADKVVYFIAPMIFGGDNSKTSVEGKGVDKISMAVKFKDMSFKRIGEDLMLEAYCVK